VKKGARGHGFQLPQPGGGAVVMVPFLSPVLSSSKPSRSRTPANAAVTCGFSEMPSAPASDDDLKDHILCGPDSS
jgi:hypothetical protein